MHTEGLNALIFGSTGAIGAELVALLLANPKWTKIHCIARKQLQEWKTLPGKEKLTVQVYQNLDDYFKKQNSNYKGFDSLFCCFGSQTKHGQETFVKVDKTYPLWAADIAIKNNVPHYLLLSSTGSDANSWFMYPKIKGQVEIELKQKKLNLLSILKPGLLKNRRDARVIQKIGSFLPFFPAIEAKDAAESMRVIAQKHHQDALKAKSQVQIFQNKDLLRVLQQERQN